MTEPKNNPDPIHVLGKAVISAAERLAISHAAFANILGASLESVSQFDDSEFGYLEIPNQLERAILFLRLYQSLVSIVGNDELARQWLRSENQGLGGRPFDMIQGQEGLVQVIQYLESSHARS